jgi:hypothetical protein
MKFTGSVQNARMKLDLLNGKRRSGITGYFTNKNDYLPLYLP